MVSQSAPEAATLASHMTVVFDARTAATGRHGIARATSEWLRELPAALAPGERLLVLENCAPAIPGVEPAAVATPGYQAIRCDSAPYSFKEQWEIPRALRSAVADPARDSAVYHSPTFWGPLWGTRFDVLTLHDLIHPLFYGDRKPHLRVLYQCGVRRLVQRARRVVTGSEASARSIRSFFQLSEERVRVLPYGCDHAWRTPARAPERIVAGAAAGEFFYAMGNPRHHKNLRFAVECYELYRREVSQPIPLWVIGGDASLAVGRPGVEVLRDISDGELRWIRENARAGMFPSRMEGFDLPLLEAIVCGGVAVASDIAPHREVVGAEYPLYPLQLEVFADALRTVDSGDPRVQWGKQRRQFFSWRRAAEGLVDLWRELVAAPQHR